ncbi:MAG: translocation/assembly module TamB domain-containing protein, partial [Candidatus Halalkalibacterium sp. M3_1C_030]
VKEEPEYSVDLSLVSPEFSTVRLQDVKIKSEGRFAGNDVEGSFMLNFVGPEESELNHGGSYLYSDSTVVTTDQLEMTSSLGTLSLQSPFKVHISGQAVRIDTMHLSSEYGAMLELAVPYADSLRQQGYLRGRNLNLSIIQSTLLGESYFDGILSGRLSAANSDTVLVASAELSFSEINYRGAALDSLNIGLELANEQLQSRIRVIDTGDELLVGDLRVPFRLGDPQQFDESFFENRVKGSLRVKRLALGRFEGMLHEMGIQDTEGILRLRADLNGTAGTPEFKAKLSLDSAKVSGVKIDSITAGVDYMHEASTLSMKATVHTLKQKVADIAGKIPFYIDVKQGDFSLPGEQDSINVDIKTESFNLATLNDFVDSETIRNIKGQLKGDVRVTGTPNDLNTRGNLNITEGAMRVVETGVTIDGIKAGIDFKPDLIRVTDFSARSGSGSLNMNGSIAFEELVPGDINLSMRARNFRVANTSEYNAAIDMNTKVTGSFNQPDVSGSLTVLNGFVQLDNFGEKSVEDIQLDTTEQAGYSMAVYDSLSMDMDISFNRRFFIRNQRYLELEVELDGSVDMLKETGEDLQMFGSLSAVNGYARPLGKRFELEEGVVTFTGDPTNPNLNIRTIFEPPRPEEEVKIWYVIEGSVEDPQFKYESSPPMELEDILCYTLFGQPCFALESWKQAVASTGSNTGATGLALELFSDRIETLASQSLGIDVVKIENTTIGGEAGTSITTGWYINPKVFFAIQNVITGSSPDTSFLLEYMLLENLKLIISQGNDARQGVDIKWNYDY